MMVSKLDSADAPNITYLFKQEDHYAVLRREF